MDFAKIVEARDQIKSARTELEEMPASKPGPKPRASSKRNDPDWVAATLFLRRETKAELERFLAALKLEARDGTVGDQSEAVEAALQLYLKREISRLQRRFPAAQAVTWATADS